MMTKVQSDIDFEKDGQQFSFLKIPHSRNSSAWGNQLIPIVVFKNGTGPTILLSGGVHGDEYEGPVALSKLVRGLRPEMIQGRVIVLPALNFPAHAAGTRLSPVDGRDLNRSFPGRRDGGITEIIAHYVDQVVFPFCDVVLDFHSGGYSLDFLPAVVMHELENAGQMGATRDALLAFGAPCGHVLFEVDGGGTLDFAAEQSGKIFLSTELRGGGRVDPLGVEVAENGIRNILRHFQIADLQAESEGGWNAKRTERLFRIPSALNFVHAGEAGLFEGDLVLGASVAEGRSVGRTHFLGNLQRAPEELVAKCTGTLICKRAPGRVEPGDCVAVIGI